MSDYTSSNKRIAKNSIFLSLRMVIVLAISLYTTRIVLNVLGVVDYGVYNVVCGFVLLFGFLNTSMNNGIQRFFNYEYGKNGEEGSNKVFCTSIIIQSLFAIIIVLLTEIIGLWYLNNKMVIPVDRMIAARWIFQFAILTFVFGIMQSPYAAAVSAHEKFDFYAVISVIEVFLKLLFVLLLTIISADKLIIYGLLTTIVSLIDITIYFIYCKQNFKELRFNIQGFDLDLFKKMLGFSGWNIFGSLSGVIEQHGINLLLNFFFGPVVNAARGIASQINSGILNFVANIATPVRPQVTQSYAIGDTSRTMKLTYSVSKLGAAIIIMFSVPVAVEINYLLHIWLGDTIPDYTKTFTVLILITQLVNSLNAAISNVVHATGVMRDYQLWSSIVRCISIPVAFIALKFYPQPEFALIAVFVCACLSHIVGLIILKKLIEYSLRTYLKSVCWPIFIILILSIVIVYIPTLVFNECFARLLFSCILSVVVVCSLFYSLAFDSSEKILIQQLTSPIINIIKSKI